MIKRFRVKERQIIYAQSSQKSIVYKVKPSGWAKPGFIRDLTGWDGEKLRQAREQGLVEYEDRKDGRYYNIDSIHPDFKKGAK